MRDLKKVSRELARNGIEVTPDQAGDLVEIAQRMGKVKKLSQWQLLELKSRLPKDDPDLIAEMDQLLESILSLK